MQNDLISCWTFTLSIYTRATHGWSSMQTGPHTKQLKGTAVAGSHHQAALHACTAFDCIQSCQHWCNCVTIWTPFSSLLPENWIANSTFFFPSEVHCSHTPQKAIGANPLTKMITAEGEEWKILFKADQSTSTDQLPKQSQHPQYRLPQTDCTAWQSWVKVRSRVVSLSILLLLWEGELGRYCSTSKQGAAHETPGNILPVWDGASPCLCRVSSSTLSL